MKRDDTPTVEDLRCAEIIIIKAVQTQAFSDQMNILETKTNDGNVQRQQLRKKNPLYKLDTFVDNN